jgi:hypothetical protein
MCFGDVMVIVDLTRNCGPDKEISNFYENSRFIIALKLAYIGLLIFFNVFNRRLTSKLEAR